jgi:O-antigen/teichoic acid export membrane protein
MLRTINYAASTLFIGGLVTTLAGTTLSNALVVDAGIWALIASIPVNAIVTALYFVRRWRQGRPGAD